MTQRLPAVLTPIETALHKLLANVGPVAPVDVPIAEAVGRVAAGLAPLQHGHPTFNVAASDGWALRALDTVGASSYAPLQLATSPTWADAGDRLPDGYDCVLDADLVEQTGPMFQILSEAIPGQGIRRAGDDLVAGRPVIAPGKPVTPFDALVARAAGLDRIPVRSPRVAVVDVASADGADASSRFIHAFAEAAGAQVIGLKAEPNAADLFAAIREDAYDLIVTVGGTGGGRADATIAALAARGADLIHGLAMQPGRTAAAGKIDAKPLVAAPGAPDQALAACLMLIGPALERLAGRTAGPALMRPLARKIASSIGIAELVLLETRDDAWMPIAVGNLSLDAIARAEAWRAVPADSEGYAAGTAVGAHLLGIR